MKFFRTIVQGSAKEINFFLITNLNKDQFSNYTTNVTYSRKKKINNIYEEIDKEMKWMMMESKRDEPPLFLIKYQK